MTTTNKLNMHTQQQLAPQTKNINKHIYLKKSSKQRRQPNTQQYTLNKEHKPTHAHVKTNKQTNQRQTTNKKQLIHQ